jgi:arylsulfatase A-like enzyme
MPTPNILFLCLDCLRSDTLQTSRAYTPNLQRLIRQGTLFPTTIAVTTTTSPSIASMLTGLYPHQHGIISLAGYKLNATIQTLPQLLAPKGYHTRALVTGPLTEDLGLSLGFQHYQYREESANLHTNWKQELIRSLQTTPNPWMCFVHIWELHLPRVVPEYFRRKKFGACQYEQALSGIDAQLADVLQNVDLENTIIILCGDHGESIVADNLRKILFWIWKHRSIRSLAQVSGSLLDALRKYVPFGPLDHYRTGFHGEMEGHGFHVYDYLVKVPLLLVGPEIPENLVIAKQISQVDITPTLLDMIKSCDQNQSPETGRSLIPLIQNPQTESWKELAYVRACGKVLLDKQNWLTGLRTPKWKYACAYTDPREKEQLYDLERDPLELKNVAHRYPDIVENFRRSIENITRAETYNLMTDTEQQQVQNKLQDLGYL